MRLPRMDLLSHDRFQQRNDPSMNFKSILFILKRIFSDLIIILRSYCGSPFSASVRKNA